MTWNLKMPKYGEEDKVIETRKILKNIIQYSNNDENISKTIMNYLYNDCNRCHKKTEKNLTVVMSFNDGIKDYNFKDRVGTKYGLKKFCDECIWGKASPCKIYVEI